MLVTSDLHLGITPERALAGLAARMRALKPSVLLVLGDVGEGSRQFERALEILGAVAPLQGLILGNHDVWSEPGASSRELLEHRLPEIAAAQGFEYLEDRLWRVRDTAIVASAAWYDYSAIDAAHRGVPVEEVARRKGDFNNDAHRIDWPWSDLEVAARCRASVERRIAEAEADPRVLRIVVATHVPVVEAQVVRREDDPRWGFSNAYFGHLTLGAAVLRSPKVTEIVSGHTHAERDEVVERPPLPPVRARVVGSAYGNPEFVSLDVPRGGRAQGRA